MSQSSTPQSSGRVVLFQHGGELSEFADILEDLAVRPDECEDAFPNPERFAGARLVIVSASRLLESGTPDLSLWPRTIAVVDDSSRTLVTHLNRVGVSMVIRRPIHPRALRLLLLHEIYCGPERRSRRRISIGHPIRIGSGLFRPQATLLELSSTAARIELANAPKVGTQIRLLFGKDLTKHKALKLQAKVVRSIRASDAHHRPEAEISVVILDADQHAKAIQKILDRFAISPAKWNTNKTPRRATPNRTRSGSKPETFDPHAEPIPPTASGSPPDSPPPTVEPELDDAIESHVELDALEPDSNVAQTPGEPEAGSDDRHDRRHNTRIPYNQRVVALGEEAARVLVGRDLASGGMRIEATPSISLGDVFRIALHSGAESDPVVVVANVVRDDGANGIMLSFNDLSPAQSEQLEKIINSSLPVHANTEDMGDAEAIGEAIVVAEILDSIKPEEK